MKKLLSLLSVLTINSSAIPTTIAASNYEKDTNTETLKRRKRQNSPKEEKIIEEIEVSKISDFSGFAKTCFILSIMSILIFYNPEIDNNIAQEIAQKLVDYLNINELGTDIVNVKKNLIIF